MLEKIKNLFQNEKNIKVLELNFNDNEQKIIEEFKEKKENIASAIMNTIKKLYGNDNLEITMKKNYATVINYTLEKQLVFTIK